MEPTHPWGTKFDYSVRMFDQYSTFVFAGISISSVAYSWFCGTLADYSASRFKFTQQDNINFTSILLRLLKAVEIRHHQYVTVIQAVCCFIRKKICLYAYFLTISYKLILNSLYSLKNFQQLEDKCSKYTETRTLNTITGDVLGKFQTINKLRLRQNRRHVVDDILTCNTYCRLSMYHSRI